jgi:hypothetical protein
MQSEINVTSGKMRMPVLIVGYKAVDQAFRENCRMVDVRSVKFDVTERAQESRNYVFKAGAGREKLWETLRETVGRIVKEDVDMRAPVEKKKKSVAVDPILSDNFDDVF